MVTEQQFREVVRRMVDAEKAGDWDAMDDVVDEYFTSDYVGHLPGAADPVRGQKELKEYWRNVVGSISGMRSTIEDLFVAGENAAGRFTARSTDPATGKTRRATVILISHLQGGKFAEDWEVAGEWEDEG